MLSTAVRSSFQENTILISDATVILCKIGSCTCVQDVHIRFTPSASTYSIDDYNAKVNIAVIKQR